MRPTATLTIPGMPSTPGLTVRPFTDASDYARMAALTREANAHDGIPSLPTEEDTRARIQGAEGLDRALDIVLVEVGGVLVALAIMERVLREGAPTYEATGRVHPEWRRRGIGGALMDRNLDRAQERARVEDPDVAVALRAHAAENETGLRTLLAARGFTPIRHFFLMRRRGLADVSDAPLPNGIVLQPVTPDQHRAIWEAEHEAFRDHWGARAQTEHDFQRTYGHSELDTSLWVVAWDGNDVAGVVQTWIWPVENDRLGVHRGWLETISVRRPWRKRGLGRAITAAALRRLHDTGMTEAMLGVDAENPTGALGLYESLGFELFSRSAAYQRGLRDPIVTSATTPRP